MSERIDYVSSARQHLEDAADAAFASDNWRAGYLAQKAQAEATLAMVEQQRIASIIAWTTANGSEPDEVVAQIVRRGLGL